MRQVAVIIPVYQRKLSSDELFSLQLAKKYLSGYPWIFVAPEGYEAPSDLSRISNAHWEYFSSEYFASIKQYSALLLSTHFYERFQDFTYIFVYQLDGLVLQDRLGYWCKQNYSYIGAPWRYSVVSYLTHPERKFLDIVGNGGISLRKVEDHIRVLKHLEKNTSTSFSWSNLVVSLFTGKSQGKWMKTPAHTYPFNEDGFWSLEAQKYDRSFTIAPVERACSFALEKYAPYYSKHFLNGALPFCTHAWKKYDASWWERQLTSNKISI